MTLSEWLRDQPTAACRLCAWGGGPETIRRIGADLYEIDRGFGVLSATRGGLVRNFSPDCLVERVPDSSSDGAEP